MPHRYHFLEPNHNKVDKDEYDFSRYNHSPFPGLDSTMPNSYANNLLQCLYFVLPLRAAIVGHHCPKEYCLTCELGFLFYMLDNAPNGTPCQASNFLRAFRAVPEVLAFKLVLPGKREEEGSRRRRRQMFTPSLLTFLSFLQHRGRGPAEAGGLLQADAAVASLSPPPAQSRGLGGGCSICSSKCYRHQHKHKHNFNAQFSAAKILLLLLILLIVFFFCRHSKAAAAVSR